jgi:hypothetical protein
MFTFFVGGIEHQEELDSHSIDAVVSAMQVCFWVVASSKVGMRCERNVARVRQNGAVTPVAEMTQEEKGTHGE